MNDVDLSSFFYSVPKPIQICLHLEPILNAFVFLIHPYYSTPNSPDQHFWYQLIPLFDERPQYQDQEETPDPIIVNSLELPVYVGISVKRLLPSSNPLGFPLIRTRQVS